MVNPPPSLLPVPGGGSAATVRLAGEPAPRLQPARHPSCQAPGSSAGCGVRGGAGGGAEQPGDALSCAATGGAARCRDLCPPPTAVRQLQIRLFRLSCPRAQPAQPTVPRGCPGPAAEPALRGCTGSTHNVPGQPRAPLRGFGLCGASLPRVSRHVSSTVPARRRAVSGTGWQRWRGLRPPQPGLGFGHWKSVSHRGHRGQSSLCRRPPPACGSILRRVPRARAPAAALAPCAAALQPCPGRGLTRGARDQRRGAGGWRDHRCHSGGDCTGAATTPRASVPPATPSRSLPWTWLRGLACRRGPPAPAPGASGHGCGVRGAAGRRCGRRHRARRVCSAACAQQHLRRAGALPALRPSRDCHSPFPTRRNTVLFLYLPSFGGVNEHPSLLDPLLGEGRGEHPPAPAALRPGGAHPFSQPLPRALPSTSEP